MGYPSVMDANTPVSGVIQQDWRMIEGYGMALVTLPAILLSRMRAAEHWCRKDAVLFTL